MNIYDSNIIFTARLLPDLEKQLENINNEDNIFSLTSSDVPNLLIYGNPVWTTENPVNEIIQEYQKLEISKDGIYIIAGLELGYMLHFFYDNCPGKIILYEPSLENIKYTLKRVSLINELRESRIYIATTMYELNNILEELMDIRRKIYLTANQYYQNKYSDDIKIILEKVNSYQLPQYKKGENLKLNIGPGHWVYKDWRTMDCYRSADFEIDLRNFDKFDIEDNCIEKAFSSHCFEHITDEDIQKVFNELYRTMKKGGILRFSCPDAEKAINAYKNNDIKWFNWVKQAPIHEMLLNVFVSYEKFSGGPKASKEEVDEKLNTLSLDNFINWCVSLKDTTKPYIAHMNGIYFEKMENMLKKAGFINITKSEFLKSKDDELRDEHFDKYPEISLYVECEK
ncbi:methyltransferase domain-containing protein [bacterium]|nr:methyltransferase domain-containing protein [bacterium]